MFEVRHPTSGLQWISFSHYIGQVATILFQLYHEMTPMQDECVTEKRKGRRKAGEKTRKETRKEGEHLH